MVAAKPVLAAVLAIGIGYAAAPYVTLYRLGHAVQAGDDTALRRLVDWPAVREGIKEDVCDDAANSKPQPVSDSLPAFGTSFVRNIAANAIDQQVTPRHLVELTRHNAAGAARHALRVTWAFFQSPTDFVADVTAPSQPGPIRLQMMLRHGTWQVTRIWLPHSLLQQANGT